MLVRRRGDPLAAKRLLAALPPSVCLKNVEKKERPIFFEFCNAKTTMLRQTGRQTGSTRLKLVLSRAGIGFPFRLEISLPECPDGPLLRLSPELSTVCPVFQFQSDVQIQGGQSVAEVLYC